MKPIQLMATAFGPFADSVTVDFDRLAAAPLFLIHGDTGAGKTSLLDALCFALYGEATGPSRLASMLRSDFAPPDRPTEVALVFELAGSRYRVQRQPTQPRPKARGEGFVTARTTALLYRLGEGDSETLLADKPADADAQLRSLLGLSVEQFRQVIVLPQGAFQRFLYAETRDRERIFESLFATDRYRRLTEQLKTEAAALADTLRQGTVQIDAQLAALEIDSLAALDAAIDDGAALLKQREQTFAALDAQVSQLREWHLKAQRLSRLHDDLAAALKQQQAHLERAAAMAALGERILATDEALQIADRFLAQTQARREASQAENALQTRKEQDAIARQQRSAAEAQAADLPLLKEQRDAARQELAALDAQADAVRALAKVREALSAARTEEAKALKLADKAGARAPVIEQSRRDAQAQLDALATVLTQRERLAMLRQRVAEDDQVFEELEGLDQRLNAAALESEEAQAVALTAEAALKDARERLERAQRAQQGDQAAHLAATLMAGEPCPVCGSRTHPAPAASASSAAAGALPSLVAAERACAAAQTQAQAERSVAEERLRTLSAHRATLKDAVPAAQRTANRTALAALKQEIHQAEQDRSVAQAELDRLTADATAFAEQITSAQQSLQQARLRLTRDEAAEATLRQQLGASEMSFADWQRQREQAATRLDESEAALTQRQSALQSAQQQQQQASERLREAEDQRSTRAGALTETEEAWRTALGTSRFVEVEDFERAYARREEIGALRRQHSNYEAEGARLIAIIAESRSQIDSRPRPDLEALSNDLEVQNEALAAAQEALAKLKVEQAQRHKVQSNVSELVAAQRKAELAYGSVGELAQHASGQSGQRVSLQSFVQGAVLDQVLSEASARLLAMSGGQFRLLRRQETADRRRSFGLELDVEDHLTGEQRPVQSLSGGESFLAALALALSLSDVVRAFAGGVRIDALFVDEGFGSLDPEALDRALSQLVSLGGQGRMVGIISHVSELKERIPTQLRLYRSDRGSRVEVSL